MIKIKDLKAFLAKLDPSLDEARIVKEYLDHSYCDVNFEITDAEMLESRSGYHQTFLEYYGEKHMEPGGWRIA